MGENVGVGLIPLEAAKMAYAFPMNLETTKKFQVNGGVVRVGFRSSRVMNKVPDAVGNDFKPVPVNWKRSLLEVLHDLG